MASKLEMDLVELQKIILDVLQRLALSHDANWFEFLCLHLGKLREVADRILKLSATNTDNAEGISLERPSENRTASEWRPIDVLTPEVTSRHRAWLLRGAGVLLDLLIFDGSAVFYDAILAGPRETAAKFPQHYTCRPVATDDGMPIPWSEVGL